MSRGVSKPRGVPGKIAQAVAIREAEPDLPINDIERCGISRSSVVKGLAAHAARQAYQRREYVAASVDRHAAMSAAPAAAERLTATQIYGLETWLQHVDPDDPVRMPQLVIDAVQALVEEAREWRAGGLVAADVDVLRGIRQVLSVPGSGMDGIVDRAARLALLDRMLAAHGAKP